jgi:hypothetical protein
MNQPRKLISIGFIAAVIIFGGRISFAQAESKTGLEPNYEAMLYVILGSDDTAQRGELPKSLSAVSRQIRDNFAFQNYKLVNTYLGRIANSGSLEYKSVSNIFGAEQNADSPSFLEWNIAVFRNGIKDGAKTAMQIDLFRFGARVPVRVSTVSGETNKPSLSLSTNYESVGLKVHRVGIAEDTPTLIGNISLPKTTGTVFLVLAIRPV